MMYQTIFLQAGGGGIGNYVLIPLMFLVAANFVAVLALPVNAPVKPVEVKPEIDSK